MPSRPEGHRPMPYYSDQMAKALVGQIIQDFAIDEDRQGITFQLAGERPVRFVVDAD